MSTDLPTRIRETIATTGWPTWRGISDQDASSTCTFRIQLSTEKLKAQARDMNLSEDPTIIIARARETSLRSTEREPNSDDRFSRLWSNLEDGLIALIYGSNRIESAGTSLSITNRLCRDVFQGKPIPDIHENTPEYLEHVEYLQNVQRKTDKSEVIRSRLEVIQHAKALVFLIDQVALKGNDLTEELILQTHAILCHGLGDEDNIPGQYRTHRVAVCYTKPGEQKTKKKTTECLRPAVVPAYMGDLVKHLKEELSTAEENKEIDPYTLAARYHTQFVMIHPFADGNGRMSRIILNVLLLRYAGHVCVFGGDDMGQEKEEYLGVVTRGARIFHEEDMEVGFRDQSCHLEFAGFVLGMSRGGLEGLWSWARS